MVTNQIEREITMTQEQFLERLYDLIGEYTYNNPHYEDINDGHNTEYNNGDKFCITIEIEKY